MMSAGGAGGHTTKSQTPDSKEPIAGSKVKHPVKFSAKEKQRGRERKRKEERGRVERAVFNANESGVN